MNPTYDACSGKYLIMDDELVVCRSEYFSEISTWRSVYEVVRLMDGVPLFLEDHLRRLENSIRFMHREMNISIPETVSQIRQLSEKNQISDGNVKIILSLSRESAGPERPKKIISFIPHRYPDAGTYERGIKMQSFELERPLPNAKFINAGVTEQVNALKAATDADEILLVNHEGLITEGSKSNVFFVDGEKVITPERELVLPGITRDKVIEISKKEGIQIEERKIALTELNTMTGAFITGTSPKVMPVRQIDELKFDPQLPVIQKLRELYNDLIREELGRFKF